MMRTVRFDDDSRGEAHEVHNVWAKRHLTSELQAIEAPVSEQTPQLSLVEGRLSTHPAGGLAESGRDRRH
jgi:hypothetical protein